MKQPAHASSMRLASLIRRRHSRMWQKIRPVSIQEGVTLLIMRQVVGKPQFVRYRKHAHLIPKLFHFDTGRNFCQILPIGRSIAVGTPLLEASHGRMSILTYREMCQEAASSASHREMRGGIAPFGIGAPAQRRPGSIGGACPVLDRRYRPCCEKAVNPRTRRSGMRVLGGGCLRQFPPQHPARRDARTKCR